MTSFCLSVNSDFIDLSYSYDNDTIFWPGGETYNHCLNVFGSGKTHYAAGTFTCAEHGGTHVDAPYHFAEDGITVDVIPINDLIAPCIVIDISDKVLITSDYLLSYDDIITFENKYGIIEKDTIVLIKTGWHKNYQCGSQKYLGYYPKPQEDYNPETSDLSFPGIGIEASLLLLERCVKGMTFIRSFIYLSIYS